MNRVNFIIYITEIHWKPGVGHKCKALVDFSPLITFYLDLEGNLLHCFLHQLKRTQLPLPVLPNPSQLPSRFPTSVEGFFSFAVLSKNHSSSFVGLLYPAPLTGFKEFLILEGEFEVTSSGWWVFLLQYFDLANDKLFNKCKLVNT